MAEKLTPQQHMAVVNRGGKLLVSAAAGSGKTKVLVDRLISYLTDPVQPANLDEFLIITYTKAAAAELRAKIASKLVECISENPGNRHLQQQMQRLYLTKISTVHSFCSDILREYAYRLDISGDFRVAEESECQQLQMAVIQRLLDGAYDNSPEGSDFTAFIDSQGLGRDDRQIPEIILKVYNSARCHLDPDKWLNWCTSVNSIENIVDVSETIWGSYLISDLHACLDLHINALEKCAIRAEKSGDMDKPAALLRSLINQLASLRNCSRWDEICTNLPIDYGRLVFSKKCEDIDLIERIKAIRNACKKDLEKKLRCFADDSRQTLSDIDRSSAATRGLVELVKGFAEAYSNVKKARHIMDFSDLEHKMLDLLLGKNRAYPTAIADEIGLRFREVMVDEYQDSNAVQDAIFNALTQKRQNCFMVGDVKQSIYQFRLADPGIFLEKYNVYVPAESAKNGEGRRILLSSNFRSCGAVINAVNDVFSLCMSETVGDLVYGEEETLKEGIPHVPLGEAEVELIGVDVQEDTYQEEAGIVAQRICELLDGKHMVRQEDALRPIIADDIVILLRSPGSVGSEFVYALEQRGIRCTMGGGTDLLQTEEISTLRSMLQIIRNPLQDIPLLSVLVSRVFAFTADDLATIKSENIRGSIYDALKSSDNDKAKQFVKTLAVLREDARLMKLSQLLEYIFAVTKMDSIYSSLPDGEIRVRNLQDFCQFAAEYEACSYSDIGQFIEYLDTLDNRGLSVGTEGVSSGAVTIMSIHKSKGLEFPVVFLCGLSREFNRESARAQVLCDKELGIGLSCTDLKNRVRYPTVAKRAISSKIISDGLSEELRVLYVAMTRARDRLIMTYASQLLSSELAEIVMRGDLSDPALLAVNADCPGVWVLQTALKRTEAGPFYALAGNPECTEVSAFPWLISVRQATQHYGGAVQHEQSATSFDTGNIEKIRQGLSFQYAYRSATVTPSKMTATQLKGRLKDQESAENTHNQRQHSRNWRIPSFVENGFNGKEYGNIMHAVMQYIRFEECTSLVGVNKEISRLKELGYISGEQAQMVDTNGIASFFSSELGRKLVHEGNVLREFKFSILDSGENYDPLLQAEEVLLQGVIDCAIIEDDGIIIIDFKTDHVSGDGIEHLIDKYTPQVQTYAKALSRIYSLPIKSKYLYLFCLNKFVEIP